MLLIIDFGSQVTQLIARRFREIGVYCEIWPCQAATSERIHEFAPDAIVLSGSPSSANTGDALRPPAEILAGPVPVLGICYGQQIMAAMQGGLIESAASREFGRARIRIAPGQDEHPLLAGLFADGEETVWMSHGDRVASMPPGFETLALSDHSPHAIIANPETGQIGMQFHPEVTHTENGLRFLENFVTLAGLSRDWSMATLLERSLGRIRERVGQERIICAVSGGIDSTVTATLIHRAVPGQLTCIFVDHGLLRLDE
ncbi:MAG: glutamine-hydrolyzing GMP synthase, partial [Rhodobacteraceae bacterium]|nr:glutamine-hydrolyzing GMP synthase [Paracoccaceae bacterium]